MVLAINESELEILQSNEFAFTVVRNGSVVGFLKNFNDVYNMMVADLTNNRFAPFTDKTPSEAKYIVYNVACYHPDLLSENIICHVFEPDIENALKWADVYKYDYNVNFVLNSTKWTYPNNL